MDHLLKIPTGIGDPSFWVLVGLLLFLGLLAWLKVPGLLTKALDDRAAAISGELDDARRLREEAQELLASYQRKAREAETEAEAIIEQAKKDAARMADQMRAELGERLARREQMAERKIAQAEADALNAVRTRAADVAIEAARAVIADELDDKARDALIADGLSELEKAFVKS